ncbi:MAG: sodium:solute symporter [Alloprevotella sp.]|nr:sodium:solute symporter [Alloprevotella sp.]
MILQVLAAMAAYFLLLLFVSRRSGSTNNNDTFFRAGHSSHWGMVAFGMIGASISGVSLVSVPGWVGTTGMTYLQMCFGFILGYAAVAFLLLPLYYRLRLTSIYGYLGQRFGQRAHRTGSLFFIISKLTGAAARMYLACLVLHEFVARPLGIPFPLTVLVPLLLIWCYTRRNGIAALVRTDVLQTACLLLSAAILLWAAADVLGLDLQGTITTIRRSPLSRVWEWDAQSPQAFWRQFLSGVFIVIVMTGLDQDMMQKNLTCRSLREAQRDMCTYGLCFVPVNLLLLGLGVLLHSVCMAKGLAIPSRGDELLPTVIASGVLGAWVTIPFSIGLIAAAFSSADSALTSLTTSVCVDLLQLERKDTNEAQQSRQRSLVHICIVALFLACILVFYEVGSGSVIDLIYRLASYTYAPLLGLYAFGILTRRRPADRAIPYVALATPALCAALDYLAPQYLNYHFGYELLMVGGALTFLGLWATSFRD